MANMPSVDKVQRNFRVLRNIDAKVMKKFGSGGVTVFDAYMRIIVPAVKDVELDAADRARIARDRDAAIRKRKTRRNHGEEMRFR